MMMVMMIKANISNIHRIKNFLDKDSYSFFLSLFKNNYHLNNPDNVGRSMLSHHHCIEDQELLDRTMDYANKVVQLASELFGLDLMDLSGVSLRNWNPGEFQPPHSDCEADIILNNNKLEVGPYFNFSSLFIEYAGLTYLNNDYSGGAIYFPQHDLKIYPEPNEFIAFPGTKYYLHGVEEVRSGKRYVMQNFMTSLKARYIWENFVLPDQPITFSSKTLDQAMYEKVCYDRSNIPEHFIFNRR